MALSFFVKAAITQTPSFLLKTRLARELLVASSRVREHDCY